MEELEYGPNGANVYCHEYMLENMSWLEEQFDQYDDDEYLILDCSGQVSFSCRRLFSRCLKRARRTVLWLSSMLITQFLARSHVPLLSCHYFLACYCFFYSSSSSYSSSSTSTSHVPH